MIDAQQKEPEEKVGTKKKPLWEADQEELKQHAAFARRATEWLTIRDFDTTKECLDALRADGRTIWATDLSQKADRLVTLAAGQPAESVRAGEVAGVPEKLAIVFGTESVGCTEEMLTGADRRVYLPLRCVLCDCAFWGPRRSSARNLPDTPGWPEDLRTASTSPLRRRSAVSSFSTWTLGSARTCQRKKSTSCAKTGFPG